MVKVVFNLLKVKKMVSLVKSSMPKIKQEVKETKEMIVFLRKGDFKKANPQLKDIGKISVVIVVFAIPFVGGVLTGLILKSNKLRPSAFVS